MSTYFEKNHDTLTVKGGEGVNPYGQPDRKKAVFFTTSLTNGGSNEGIPRGPHGPKIICRVLLCVFWGYFSGGKSQMICKIRQGPGINRCL